MSTSEDVLQKIKEGLKSLPAPLLSRQFNKSPSPSNNTGCVVRVMQWNILAQALALGKDNFVQCPDDALKWDTRKYRILEEILCYDADVVCLQEVDVYPYVKGKLEKFGYTGLFIPKPDSPCLYVPPEHLGPDGGSPDGCAIFYKSAKYRLLSHQSMPLQINTRDTNQVTILALFEEVVNRHACQFVVAVTHLKAKKGFDEIRHKQGLDLLHKVQEFAGDKPVIVCGDFNATPDEPVYSAFSQSTLNLNSAYKMMNNDTEPEYTTWKIRGSPSGNNQTEYCRTIDYIWVTKEKIEVLDCLKFPTGEEIGPGRLPSFSYASDHLSLVVDLLVK